MRLIVVLAAPSDGNAKRSNGQVVNSETILTAGWPEPQPEVVLVPILACDPVPLDVPHHLPDEWTSLSDTKAHPLFLWPAKDRLRVWFGKEELILIGKFAMKDGYASIAKEPPSAIGTDAVRIHAQRQRCVTHQDKGLDGLSSTTAPPLS